LTYAIDVEPSLLSLRVPALVLRPLVENAIKHGVADAVGGGRVCVRGWRDADRVHFTVMNTGDGAGAPGGTGEGLDSVRRRLRATFGPDAAVTLTSSHGATEAHIEFQGQR
jgi:LytS/YehU family sensor histidine kinase